ncbi:MAG TPA: 50S ribosomal protein L21 [Anaerolineales bacterium]|nr:50S ribosomal protein L21 [Anaerolineales bacterium]
MKYAIFAHGGKQYLAQEGARIEVDRMPLEVGKPVEFQEILLVSDGRKTEVGSPYVPGAKVQGTIVEHPNGKKIIVFKYIPKHRYRRTKGQRRRLTTISIEAVGIAGADEPAPVSPRKPAPRPAAKPAAKPPAKPPAKRASVKRGPAKPSGQARKTAGKPKSARAKKK